MCQCDNTCIGVEPEEYSVEDEIELIKARAMSWQDVVFIALLISPILVIVVGFSAV